MKQVYKLTYMRDEEAYTKYIPKMISKDRAKLMEDHGASEIRCVKCYPINMMEHQHDFEHISTLCRNEISDMEDGIAQWSSYRYEFLKKMAEKAEYFFGFFGMDGYLAWFPYEEWKEAKEMISASEIHRDMASAMATNEEEE